MMLSTLLTIRDMEDRPLFRIAEVCALLNVKRITVYRWARLGKIKTIKVNGKTRWITRESLAAFVAAEAN